MTTMKKTIADILAAFDSKNAGGNTSNYDTTWKKFFQFWKIPVDGTATVRFLPDQDETNPLSFLVENYSHELIINGKKETVACNKHLYGERCPICELSARFYDENSPDHNEALGKQFYRKKSYIGQVLVVDAPIEHDQDQLVKLIEFGPQVMKQIEAGFRSGDLDEPAYEYKGGYNFRIRKTTNGQQNNSYTTSSFAPKQTDLDDALIEEIKANLYNLADYRAKRYDLSTLETMLAAASMEMTPYGSPAAQTAAPAAAAPVSTAPVAQTASPTAPTAAGLSMVEQLKQRAAAAKAAQAAQS